VFVLVVCSTVEFEFIVIYFNKLIIFEQGS
jgi:hypothetical protein